MPQVILSHPTGNAFVREALRALQDADMLSAFCTSLGFHDNDPWLKLPIPQRWKHKLERRHYAIPKAKLKRRPCLEITRLLGQRILGSHFKAGPIDAIYATVDKLTADNIHQLKPDGVYAYEDGALESFKAATTLSVPCFYELPIAYWKELHKLLEDAADRRPDWAPTLAFQKDSTDKCAQKDEELTYADSIICPSKFVYDSLPDSIKKEKPCTILPYGAPPPQTSTKQKQKTKTLRVLFAGALSQRKGLADLFDAINLLNRSDIELITMGSLQAPLSFYQEACPHFTYESPRPHQDVLKLMQSCDVFALPSIVEGRALVQLEALSCGLPLLITPNTGGEDLIKETETGFLVPPHSPQAIAEKLNWLADNKDALPSMQAAALNQAKKSSRGSFRHQWIQHVKKAFIPS